MLVRNNQGVFYNTLGSSSGGGYQTPLTGRVFHVVVDDKSIGFTNWSNIGDVYYTDPSVAPPEINSDTIKNLTPAKALFPQYAYIPLKGELIMLLSAQSSDSSDVHNSKQIYYLSSINLFNNTNHNSQGIHNIKEDGSLDLGASITESSTVGNIFPFEGDHILYGRWGNGIRFGSTLNENNLENFWSITGKNGDPITLLVNGYNFTKDLMGRPYVEDINNDKSSLYLTSTQAIPIDISNNINNPLINPINPSKYFSSQAILNANRILINSNKDEILLYSKTNTIISSKDTIYLNSDRNILLDSQYIFLGTNKNNQIPTEPALLGNKTITLLNDLIISLFEFSSDLTSAMETSSGRLLLSITQPANSLEASMDKLMKQLESLKSQKVYIS